MTTTDTPDTTRLSEEAVHPSWMPDDAFLDYMEQRFSQLIDRCDGLTNDMTPARRAKYKSTDIGYLSMRLLNRHRTLAAELARVTAENERLALAIRDIAFGNLSHTEIERIASDAWHGIAAAAHDHAGATRSEQE